MQNPAAVTTPDFFPAEKPATPPPLVVQEETDENFFPYDDFYPLDQAVNHTDPTPSNAASRPSRRCRTYSLSSSLYGDSPEVSASDPSPAVTPTYAQVAIRPRQGLSSSSSTSSRLSLPFDGVASRTHSRSRSLMPECPKIYMPQISFDPLPVLKEGEGLEENEDVAISIVDGRNSWTVVQRRKTNKKKKDTLSEKWTKQQKDNFEHFGDI